LLQDQNDNINSQKNLLIQRKQFNEPDKLRKPGKNQQNLRSKSNKSKDSSTNKNNKELMRHLQKKMKENLDKDKSRKQKKTKEISFGESRKGIRKNGFLEELEKLNSKLERRTFFDKKWIS
jgi:hypothetical protein